MGGEVGGLGHVQEFRRELGFWDVFIYGMLFMTLIAPMPVFGHVSKESGMMAPFVYFVGMCAMFFTAQSYAKMSGRFPSAGSVYAHVQRGLNHHAGFIAGWLILLDYILIPALIHLITANWCVGLFPGTSRWFWIPLFVILTTAINVRGISCTALADRVIFCAEAGILAAFVAAGLHHVLGEGGGAGALTLDPLWRPGGTDFRLVGAACAIACFSFLGFDGVSALAEETRHPEATIGRATLAALFCVGALFILQTYVATIIQPDPDKLDPDRAFLDAAILAGGETFGRILAGVNILAAVTATLTAQAATSRVLYGMARDGTLPLISRHLRHVHPRFRTPWLATLFTAGVSLAAAAILSVGDLARLVNFGALAAFMMLHAAVFNLFWRREGARGARAVIHYVFCPLCGMLILGWVQLSFDAFTWRVGLAWLASGLIVGHVTSDGWKIVPPALREKRPA